MYNKIKITIEAKVPDCYTTNDITWTFLKAFKHSSDLDMIYEEDIHVEEIQEEIK